jgi:hypothetical protein
MLVAKPCATSLVGMAMPCRLHLLPKSVAPVAFSSRWQEPCWSARLRDGEGAANVEEMLVVVNMKV